MLKGDVRDTSVFRLTLIFLKEFLTLRCGLMFSVYHSLILGPQLAPLTTTTDFYGSPGTEDRPSTSGTRTGDVGNGQSGRLEGLQSTVSPRPTGNFSPQETKGKETEEKEVEETLGIPTYVMSPGGILDPVGPETKDEKIRRTSDGMY